jgi:hypothetical protein
MVTDSNWAWGVATSQKVQEPIPGGVIGNFFRGIRQFHVPGLDSSSKNEYQNTRGG